MTSKEEDTTQCIVGFRPKSDKRVSEGSARMAHRHTTYKQLDHGRHGHCVVADLDDDDWKRLKNRSDVKYVEKDGEVEAYNTSEISSIASQSDQTVPWGVDRVKATEAHQNGYKGDTAKVGVLDTGIDSDHEDLIPHGGGSVINCGETWYGSELDSMPQGAKCYKQWDDDNSHGTHCAGIVAGLDNSKGVIGVAPHADVLAYKVLESSGSGTFHQIAEGISMAIGDGCDIISMSLGGSNGSQTLKDAAKNARDNGVLPVAATGNSGNNTVSYPAKYPEVVAVSATTESDEIAQYSNTGEGVNVAAPGSEVTSTVLDNGYASYSGTSMACPHVAGTAAIAVGASEENLSPDKLESLVTSTAKSLGFNESVEGSGLVRVDKVAEKAAPDSGNGDDDGNQEPPLKSPVPGKNWVLLESNSEITVQEESSPEQNNTIEASDTMADHTLEVISNGGRVEYEFYSSGKITPNSDLNPSDEIAENEKSVHGHCNGWHDSFDFNGAPMNFIVHEGFEYMTLELDGVEVNPSHLKMNVVEVESSDGDLACYGLSSSGKMMKRGLANSTEVVNEDNDAVRGRVKSGKDKFAYQGCLTGFWCNRDCKVTINGGEPRTVEGNPPAGSYI